MFRTKSRFRQVQDREKCFPIAEQSRTNFSGLSGNWADSVQDRAALAACSHNVWGVDARESPAQKPVAQRLVAANGFRCLGPVQGLGGGWGFCSWWVSTYLLKTQRSIWSLREGTNQRTEAMSLGKQCSSVKNINGQLYRVSHS